MIPNWSSIASSVKTIPPILPPIVLLRDHATDSQINRATTGIRKNSDQTNIAGSLGIWNVLASSNSEKQTVGLRNTANQTTALTQAGGLRRDCGIEAFMWLTDSLLYILTDNSRAY